MCKSLFDDLEVNEKLDNDSYENVETDNAADSSYCPTENAAYERNPLNELGRKTDNETCNESDNYLNKYTDNEIGNVLRVLKERGKIFLSISIIIPPKNI